MYKAVTFEPQVESLVRFVEETDPDDLIEETVGKLRDGVDPKDLLRAGALAVTRSTELPSNHHGGPIHPVAGTYPVYQIAKLLSGEMSYLPIVHHVALCNKHVHDPETGPAIMPEMEPLGAEGGAKATIDDMLFRMERKHTSYVEHRLLWLIDNVPRDELMDALLTRAVPRNAEDDHFFLYPAFTSRALDCVGWEWAKILMRPPARYLCRPTYISRVMGAPPSFEAIEELVQDYGLLTGNLSLRTSKQETASIGKLAQAIGGLAGYSQVPGLLAKAMADGLSLEGTAEALSLGATRIFLRTSYGNPMDVHLHTGINVRRYLLKMEGISLKNKLYTLLSWHTGPEVRLSEDKMNWDLEPREVELARADGMKQEVLLDAITHSIETQPSVDLEAIGPRLDLMVAADEVKDTIALAHEYVRQGYEPMALFRRLAEIGSRDDFTEMHFFKFHQAIMEEYFGTRAELRDIHLVAAAKAGAIIYGKQQDVYSRTKDLLQV